VETLRTFVTDVWDLSVDRIRRADPLLMGAAIAYNSLLALVPLALAFVTILTFFDEGSSILARMITSIEEALPSEVASFFVDLLQQSIRWAQADRSLILVVSILIALWSGSRAVYAVQKALRTVEGEEDHRGYIRSRLLGIGVTVAAGAAVMVGYSFVLVGEFLWDELSDRIGVTSASAARLLLFAVAILWTWGLLWAIYRWGPPTPLRRSGIVAAIVAALLVAGSMLAIEFFPSSGQTLSVFGAMGVFLVWLYYVGAVIVAAPTLVNALWTAIRNLADR
jgi:membrane protein